MPTPGYKPVRLSPFLRLKEVGWSTGLWMVVVVTGTPIVQHEGGGGLNGEYKAEFDVEDDPPGKAEYDGNPGTPDWDNPFGILPTPHLTRRDIREQRYLLHITKLPPDKPKGQPAEISLTIKMFGQWSTFDIPGLPIDEIEWPTYTLYMFRSTAEIDEDNDPYHLKIKQAVKKKKPSTVLEPFASVTFTAEPVVQNPDEPGGDVTNGFADIRLAKVNAQGKPFRDEHGNVIPVAVNVSLRKN